MAKPTWKQFLKTKEQAGLVRTKAPGKSPQTKMLEAIDKQIANITGGTLGAKAAWYQAVNEDWYKVNVRYGTTSLKLTPVDSYIATNELKPFLTALRDAVAKGEFDTKLAQISETMSKSKSGRSKA